MRRALPIALLAAAAVGVAAAASGDVVKRETAPCPAAKVDRNRVHAGPFTGLINNPQHHVVDGRFRLHVGRYSDPARRLSNKMAWFLPRKYAVDASWVSVKGVRLAPPGRRFSDSLAEAFGAGFPDDQHVYPSNFEPPTAGCWRLTFKTGRVSGSLVVLVRSG